MSHLATAWALKQRGLDPYEFRVLFWLCDHFNPGRGGAFPEQKLLAANCEVSRSGLNKVLDRLEAKGFIRRETRVNESNGRQISTRYHLAYERGFTPVEGAERPRGAFVETNDGEDETEARVHAVDTEPESTLERSRVHLRGHGYNAEPVIEPVRFERESARETGISQNDGAERLEASGEADIAAFRAAWPTSGVDAPEPVERAWGELGFDDRRAALAGVPAFLAELKKHGRKHVPAGASYLARRSWIGLATAQAGTPPAGGRVECRAWSREWWALFWARIAVGRDVAFLVREAQRGSAFWAAPDELAAGRPEALRACPDDGAAWPLWRAWLRARRVAVHDLPPAVTAKEGDPPRDARRVWLYLPGAAPPAHGLDVWTGFPSVGETTALATGAGGGTTSGRAA
jgi:hypothetical protein